MHTKLLTATALVGSLLLLPLMQGPAHAASLPSVPTHQNDLTLIAHPGGGGGGGGGGHVMGGGGPGGNGPHAMGGNGPHAMGGNGPHMRGGNFAQGDVREFRRGHGDFAEHNGRNNGRFAERGRDFDHHHGHRVFRNGVWVWVYGPDYYAGDCGWLLRRARVTGSPYWWSRYNACVGYY
jgi:hypothetical protein